MTIKPKACEQCGELFQPTNYVQRFCKPCAKVRSAERKKTWEKLKYPNRKPKVKCTEVCCVCGNTFSCRYDGKPYCNKHWLRMYNNGTTEPKKKAVTNRYIVEDETAKILTANGEEILVDATDLDLVKDHSWCVSSQGYAVANIDGRVVKINRYILGNECEGKVVDHINRNKLDNRRANLRYATPCENSRNCSKTKGSTNPYVGVRLTKSGNYAVRITADRQDIYVGTYNNLQEAIAERQKAEIKYHKEFAQHLS